MSRTSSQEAKAERLSKVANSLERSAIRLMFDMAQEYQGDDLVHLEIGEPDFDTPEHITKTALEAARGGQTHYTANAGMIELREAIAEQVRTDHGVDLDPGTQITVTCGAMEALLLALLCVVDPGQNVLIPTPAWPNYRSQVKYVGATPVEVPLSSEEDFALDATKIVRAIDDNTAAIVITSPSNPTGQVYERTRVEEVLEAAAERGVYVIADEVYEGLVYGDDPTGIASYTPHSDWVLTCNSTSKKYAMTGWRLGWLSGPEDVLEMTTMLHENTTACASSVSQHAARAALQGPQQPVREMKRAFEQRRDYLVERIASMPLVSCATPRGAFYAFLDVSGLEGTSLEISKRLLYEYEVVTTPGQGFGEAGQGHIRLSFANSLERLETAMDRIERMIERDG